MYDYLIGTVTALGKSTVVLENVGIGYEIQVPHALIPDLEGEQKIFIHEHVSENEHMLYGFPSRLGKTVFRLLIGVNGIGPKMGIRFFDQFTPEEILQHLSAKNIAELKKVKGLGIKTVEKIVIELHKKGKEMILSHSLTESPKMVSSSITEDSVAALVGLGYKESIIRQTINHTLKELQNEFEREPTSEEMIKKVLEKMAKLKT